MLARDLFAMHGREYAQLQAELKKIDAKLMAWHRANADSRRLAQIPGIGPIVATALVMKAPDPRLFPSGRHFAAWIGLTPKDHSTAGKTRLGKITRAGDEMLRSVLVAGATAVIQQARKAAAIVALVARAADAQVAEARGDSARQQDCPHRLEAVDDGRELSRRRMPSHRRTPLKRSAGRPRSPTG